MTTMNISLPDSLKEFIDRQVADGGYGTSSEYLRELIRRDRDRTQFRAYLMKGLKTPPAGAMDDGYFEALRKRAKGRRVAKA